jgi:hypothetical protein
VEHTATTELRELLDVPANASEEHLAWVLRVRLAGKDAAPAKAAAPSSETANVRRSRQSGWIRDGCRRHRTRPLTPATSADSIRARYANYRNLHRNDAPHAELGRDVVGEFFENPRQQRLDALRRRREMILQSAEATVAARAGDISELCPRGG